MSLYYHLKNTIRCTSFRQNEIVFLLIRSISSSSGWRAILFYSGFLFTFFIQRSMFMSHVAKSFEEQKGQLSELERRVETSVEPPIAEIEAGRLYRNTSISNHFLSTHTVQVSRTLLLLNLQSSIRLITVCEAYLRRSWYWTYVF